MTFSFEQFLPFSIQSNCKVNSISCCFNQKIMQYLNPFSYHAIEHRYPRILAVDFPSMTILT